MHTDIVCMAELQIALSRIKWCAVFSTGKFDTSKIYNRISRVPSVLSKCEEATFFFKVHGSVSMYTILIQIYTSIPVLKCMLIHPQKSYR